MAKENGLSGIIFSCLDKKFIDKDTYMLFQKDFYEYQQKDVFQLKAIEEVSQIFSVNSIEHIFLKGSVLKQIYPQTYMQCMGDIDILVKKDSMAKFHEVLYKITSVTFKSKFGFIIVTTVNSS